MKVLAICVALALSGAWSTPGSARERWQDAPSREDRGSRGLSPDEAARRAQQQYGGRVLSVQAEGSGYRVKLLRDGEVRTVFIGS